MRPWPPLQSLVTDNGKVGKGGRNTKEPKELSKVGRGQMREVHQRTCTVHGVFSGHVLDTFCIQKQRTPS